MEEAIITHLVVAEDIEDFVIKSKDIPVELQIRQPGDNWDTVDILLDGKLVFRADWVGNLLPFFKRAAEMWPEN